jgi:hypothetical protein
VDVRDHLRLGGAAAVLARDADDAARIDDVVRSVEDAGRGQPLAVLALRQLVIGRPRDDARAQPRDRLRGEYRAERAGGEHVDVLEQYFLDRHRARPEFITHPLQCGGSHVRGAQAGAGGREQAAQVITHAAHPLDGHRDAR